MNNKNEDMKKYLLMKRPQYMDEDMKKYLLMKGPQHTNKNEDIKKYLLMKEQQHNNMKKGPNHKVNTTDSTKHTINNMNEDMNKVIMNDRNDKAVALYINGQYKNMRDDMNKAKKINKIGIEKSKMNSSIVNNYNNRPDYLIKNKNLSNIRKLSQIADQE